VEKVDNKAIRILLVEDNPADARLIKETLFEAGAALFDLTGTGRLSDALKLLSETRYDIVLLDLSLPDSHGLDTFIKTYEHAPEVPIVVLSGLSDETMSVKAVQGGAQDYLVKGQVSSGLLVRSIRYAIERSRMLIEMEKIRKKEHQLAYYDTLTSLPNRQLFYDRIGQTISQAERYKQRVALLFLDLDGFKSVNDTIGHDIGDLLLQDVAERLQRCVRKSDTVARLGGDEFTFILPQVKNEREISRVGQKILRSLANAFEINGHEIRISGSIGVSLFPDDARNSQDLLKMADTAMYEAKRLGKNKFHFYTEKLNDSVVERLAMESDIGRALEQDELMLYYQPQVDLKTGLLTGMEALLRWKHPELGLVLPDVFIPFAEETGQILKIGEWVLRKACLQNKAWLDAGYAPMRMAVNISAHQFRHHDLAGLVSMVLDETGLDASLLGLEVTESCTMDNLEHTSGFMRMMQGKGSQVSIDDFGTGFSSLSYLITLPVDALKIDRSFLIDISNNSSSQAVVKAIITMAHSLNLNVVAEGVETYDQLRFLKQHGCNAAQGYLFSPPLPDGEITKLLQNGYSDKIKKEILVTA
jgi:diguanylate cyclase (GGDEF)-like protein